MRYLAALLLVTVVGCQSQTIRVMTYNIHHGAGEDGRIDLPRIAKIIEREKPDLVAIQEVDSGTKRIGGVESATELGRLTGMHAVFGKAIDYDGGAFGQTILSRRPIIASHLEKLPGDPAKEQRIALLAVVKFDRVGTINFVSTHLDHVGNDTDRRAQADRIIEMIGGDDTPTILAGDFNAKPGSAVIEKFNGHFTNVSGDGFTFPSTQPTRKIDFVFARPTAKWKSVTSRVIDERVASDHRPVVVDVAIK